MIALKESIKTIVRVEEKNLIYKIEVLIGEKGYTGQQLRNEGYEIKEAVHLWPQTLLASFSPSFEYNQQGKLKAKRILNQFTRTEEYGYEDNQGFFVNRGGSHTENVEILDEEVVWFTPKKVYKGCNDDIKRRYKRELEIFSNFDSEGQYKEMVTKENTRLRKELNERVTKMVHERFPLNEESILRRAKIIE